MMEVIALKLRGTISGASLADSNVCEHVANGKKWVVEQESRVIDFEIRL